MPKPEDDELDAIGALMSSGGVEDEAEPDGDEEPVEEKGDGAAILERIRADIDRLEAQLNR